MLKTLAITATCGRHRCIERSIKMFLDQTYANKHLLIFQNSEVYQELDKSVPKDLVTLVNQHLDSRTNKPFKTLGGIYMNILDHIPKDVDVIHFQDDDDLFLKTHIEKGIEGLLRGKLKAYKPAKSWFRHGSGINLMSNTLEPSIFVYKDVILENGFWERTSDQHLKWVDYLVYNAQIYVDPDGEPTLIYNWGDKDIPTFKTSGNAGKPGNFENYRSFSKEHGDKVITPVSDKEINEYYKLVDYNLA